eukprot:TRINITY_DN22586_c0_g1_i1.p1 TRINITY_DN22586_c0_g1~~TRINITY_DN22586_c0_g1_i1.p1  ORF type:complete len:302 (-),score=42.29 TRINITY_DN22586_c0_g1_i1:24-929(-)
MDEVEYLDVSHTQRTEVGEIKNLEKLIELSFRQNLISVIENLDTATTLQKLDMYDNKIKAISTLKLPNLTYLDLSFNLIRTMDNLDASALPKLKELYLIANKIPIMQNLDKLAPSLTLLELGDNRIRKIENLSTPNLVNLTSLWLGKNKIRKIEGLDTLINLTKLALPGNRILEIEGLDTLVKLEELYLSENGITVIKGLSKLKSLQILDLAKNKLTTLAGSPAEPNPFVGLDALEELWCNSNQISNYADLDLLKVMKSLTVLYFLHNPIASDTQYRLKVSLALENITELDSYPLTNRFKK